MIGWPATKRNNGKIELDPINGILLRQLFAVYGCNGTEFSYVFFYRTTEFYNGETATEWWKPGISWLFASFRTQVKIFSSY